MISTLFGVSNAGMARVAGAFRAPAAHLPSATHAGWAGAAIAAQGKRRTAAATVASVNRGFV